MESIFYRTFKVHSKVTFQSRSTEHVRLMLNQAWWTHLAIVYMSHPKSVQTLERFFAPNQSQSESENNDTEEEQCINQEETDEDRRKPKKSRDHTWLRYEKEAMFCYFCRKSKKTNPFASAEGCTNFCPPKNKNVPQNFSQGDKLSPSDQILAQTLCTHHHYHLHHHHYHRYHLSSNLDFDTTCSKLHLYWDEYC